MVLEDLDRSLPGKTIPIELEKQVFLPNTPKYEMLEWRPVSPEEKSYMALNATFNIDFVAVVGILENLLSDEDLIELIGNSSGKICQLASLQNVRTKTFGRMLLFAKLGDWMLGEPLTREVLEEAQDRDFNEDYVDSAATTSTQVSPFNV